MCEICYAYKLNDNPQCTRIVYQCRKCNNKTKQQYEKCPYQTMIDKNSFVECGNQTFDKVEVYSLDKILSFEKFMNVIIGKRRGGKTYAIAEFMIHLWVEHGQKFVWMRRYKTELKMALDSFVKLGYLIDMTGVYYETEKVTYNKNGKEIIKKQKYYIGKVITVSTASRIRGGEFQNYATLIWDEYGDEGGTELRNEFIKFNSLIVSILDMKNDDSIRVFVLSNNANRFLPLYEHIKPHWDNEWSINNKTDSVVHIWGGKVSDFTGRSAGFLSGTEYYDYAFANKPLDYDKWLIEDYHIEFCQPEIATMFGRTKDPICIYRINYKNEEKYIFSINKNNNLPLRFIDYNYIKFSSQEDIDLKIWLIDLWRLKKVLFTNPILKEDFFHWVMCNLHLM